VAEEIHVYLDHLIARQSLRYTKPDSSYENSSASHGRYDNNIRFSDIRKEEGWFDSLVKPDFQRATCAWSPDTCVKFLNSVIHRRIIPSIILWRSDETGLVYVLDGAHRLSVLRAWMIDDWGDKAAEFYKDSPDYARVKEGADAARRAVDEKIGAFSNFADAYREWNEIAKKGGAPLKQMSGERAEMAVFYSDIAMASRTLSAQWETGDYDAAEESFLAINRQGAPLDTLESLLIEFRNGSMSRIIMSVANAGAHGHYWPAPNDALNMSADGASRLYGFNTRCHNIYKQLFVPPFDAKIIDINVPFIIAPGHFRLHQHLIELLPLLSEGQPIGLDKIDGVLGRDIEVGIEQLVINADAVLSRLESKLGHLGGGSSNSLSLSLTPLVYWYNSKGGFVRALFYAWCYWLLAGSDEDIKQRKIAFSAVRGDLEDALISHKEQFAEIQHRGGAGFKSLGPITSFIQDLIELLLEMIGKDNDVRNAEIDKLFGVSRGSAKKGSSRSFSKQDRAAINIKLLSESSIKCEICGGIVDLKQGVQYDHIEKFADGGRTTPSNGRPTHPFCNLFREYIAGVKNGNKKITLPTVVAVESKAFQQLSLFDSFPGES